MGEDWGTVIFFLIPESRQTPLCTNLTDESKRQACVHMKVNVE